MDYKLDPPNPSEIAEWVYDMPLEEVIARLVQFGTDIEDALREQLCELYENEIRDVEVFDD